MYTAEADLSRQIGSHSAKATPGPVIGWLIGVTNGKNIHLLSCIGSLQAPYSADPPALLQDLGKRRIAEKHKEIFSCILITKGPSPCLQATHRTCFLLVWLS